MTETPAIEFRREAVAVVDQLYKLELANVKINSIFKRSLYSDTMLDREENEPMLTVVRKNLYFLAEQTVIGDGKDIVCQLLKRGILEHYDERTAVVKEPTELLRAISMYMIVISKEPTHFPAFLDVLSQSGNGIVAELLQPQQHATGTLQPMGNGVNVQGQGANGSGLTADDFQEHWICFACNNVNSVQNIECNGCGDRNPNPQSSERNNLYINCARCTFRNVQGSHECEMCGSELGEPDGDAQGLHEREESVSSTTTSPQDVDNGIRVSGMQQEDLFFSLDEI